MANTYVNLASGERPMILSMLGILDEAFGGRLANAAGRLVDELFFLLDL